MELHIDQLIVSLIDMAEESFERILNNLVEKFGYDVYWLEPNEWEDIPEYQ